jgi:phosphate transport system substrate-binding protein
MKRFLGVYGLVLGLVCGLAAVEVDSAIPDYQPSQAVTGELKSVGGDGLNNLMTFWAETFLERHPSVNIQIEGKGGESGPVALANRSSQIAPMIRPLNERELALFDRFWGYRPTQISVAYDALAVFVHPDNPVTSVSLKQLDQIYSSSFKRGGFDVTTWGGLSLTDEWNAMPIKLLGRNSASGSYAFFQQQALKSGTFKKSVQEKPGSVAVVQAVALDRGAIGYSVAAFATTAVRVVPLSDDEQPAVLPTHEHVLAGTYPLSRALYLYIDKKPGVGVDPLVDEFIRLVLSRTGQQTVVKDGYIPLSAAMIAEQRAKFDP